MAGTLTGCPSTLTLRARPKAAQGTDSSSQELSASQRPTPVTRLSLRGYQPLDANNGGDIKEVPESDEPFPSRVEARDRCCLSKPGRRSGDPGWRSLRTGTLLGSKSRRCG
jgi:hypothetical protein